MPQQQRQELRYSDALFAVIVNATLLWNTVLCNHHSKDPFNVVKYVGQVASFLCTKNESGEVDWTYMDKNSREIPVSNVTKHYTKMTSGIGQHYLQLDDVQLSYSGMYICRSTARSANFDSRAAYLIVVAHRPYCELNSDSKMETCWITYRGDMNVRMRWINRIYSRVVREKIFAPESTGNSVFSLNSMKLSANDSSYCEVTFLVRIENHALDVASASPDFTATCQPVPNDKAKFSSSSTTTVTTQALFASGLVTAVILLVSLSVTLLTIAVITSLMWRQRQCIRGLLTCDKRSDARSSSVIDVHKSPSEELQVRLNECESGEQNDTVESSLLCDSATHRKPEQSGSQVEEGDYSAVDIDLHQNNTEPLCGSPDNVKAEQTTTV